MNISEFLKKVFQDNTGKYVVGQPPNIPIILIIIGILGQIVSPEGSLFAEFFALLAFGAVFLWSYLEVVYGESLFRRILGGIVLILLFITRLQ